MTLRFYMDEHIPRPVSVGLRLREVDILTTQDDDRAGVDDGTLFDRAAGLGRVMVSFDADMAREATRRQREGRSFAGLVFAHPTQMTFGDCIRDLEIIAKTGEPSDLAEHIIHLPL